MSFLISSIFRSLKHRNYRLFFCGQLVSLIGSWITTTAASWLIYRLTSSMTLLASLNAAHMIPALLLSPMAGVKADEWNRKKILICTQTGSMLQSFALAVLALSEQITVAHLLILMVIQGAINAFDIPARQALVSELVEDHSYLANAIALNSTIFNCARLIGPAIGGLIIKMSNEGVCFLIDALTYLAVLLSLFLIRLPEKTTEQKLKQSVISSIKDGFTYAWRFEPIGVLLVLVASINFCVATYVVLLPAFVRDILHQGPDKLGILMGTCGAGSLLGALYLASRENVRGLGNIILKAGTLFGFSLILFSASTSNLTLLPTLFGLGFGLIVTLASANSIIQTIVDKTKRGRVMSIYFMAFTAGIPLGGAFWSWWAGIAGLRTAIFTSGIFAFLALLFFSRKLPAMRIKIRPIYIELGIISN